MIPVISLLDLKLTTILFQTIFQITAFIAGRLQQGMKSGAAKVSTGRGRYTVDANNRGWTLTAFSVRGRRHHVGHGDDEIRAEHKREKNKSVSMS